MFQSENAGSKPDSHVPSYLIAIRVMVEAMPPDQREDFARGMIELLRETTSFPGQLLLGASLIRNKVPPSEAELAAVKELRKQFAPLIETAATLPPFGKAAAAQIFLEIANSLGGTTLGNN